MTPMIPNGDRLGRHKAAQSTRTVAVPSTHSQRVGGEGVMEQGLCWLQKTLHKPLLVPTATDRAGFVRMPIADRLKERHCA